DEEVTESDREDEEEEIRQEEEESFDLIPRTPEDDENDGNGDEDQGLRISEEERIQEEEEADELYRDQESSPVSSFVTSMLNPTSDAGVESIFTMSSSLIVSLQTPTPIMTPSTIATITTSRDAPIPPTPIPIAADLTEIELKKILIEKMEGNKSIQRSDKQRNLYKALVDAYEADKTIVESYRELAILKRRREDDDDQEGPSAGSDRGSKRQREGREHASASTPSEQATGSASMSTTGTQSRQLSASESAFTEEPVQTTCQM
nr:hypothetical protein [Tanacetum cinerariifolium]